MADVKPPGADQAGRSADGAGASAPGGLVRERLVGRLTDPASYRLGWVVAPAGSGKTRLLAQVAARFPGPVVSCVPPDPVPRTEQAFLAWLAEQLVEQLGDGPVEQLGVPAERTVTLDDLLAASERPGPTLLVVDDAHLFEGSEAEAVLASVIRRLPGAWRLLVATRMNLEVDLSRLRVSGDVIDIGPDDLRFRTWEVDELFRHVYGQPLLPEDVAVLTRRTAGWAAYLQMFFLATSRRPNAERRTVLRSLHQRTRLVSDYLGRHVLSGLDAQLREFLVRTSVLRRLSWQLSDEFLGWPNGSAALLSELERRQLFTERLADDTYRYHTVLLTHLDAELVDRLGLHAAREEHRKAGVLLEREGWTEEALAAFARAEDWASLSRLSGSAVSSPAATEQWVEALPPAVLAADPLLLMAQARAELGRGSLAEAAATLRRAEDLGPSAEVADRCRLLREQILAWLEPDRPLPTDWTGALRSATQRQPGAARRHAAALRGMGARFAEGGAALLQGDVSTGSRLLMLVSGHPDATPAVSTAAGLLGLAAAALTGRSPSPEALNRLLDEVETGGPAWLARVARAVGATVGDGNPDAFDALLADCDRDGDQWGGATIAVIDGIRRLRLGDPSADTVLAAGADAFRALGARVVQARVLTLAAVAAAGAGRAERAVTLASAARALATSLDVPGVAAVADLVLPATSVSQRQAARQLLEGWGSYEWYASRLNRAATTQPAGTAPAVNGAAPSPAAPARLRLLGRFELVVAGEPVNDDGVKPMERALLHLLATAGGAPMHREKLVAALWPDADPAAGLHRLQVAVSALRRLLPAVPGGPELVSRSGDSYRLSLPQGSEVDLVEFDRAVQRAVTARAAGDEEAERAALEEAMTWYGGELLPEDGPAEWVVDARRRSSAAFADAASRLAERLLEDDPRRAGQLARSGIAADRFRDDLWKSLIAAAEHGGNQAEAEAARREYELMLEELGI